MAQRWTLKEDYIVCKFVYEHDVFISAQDLHCLVSELKENGFDRGKVAVNKRVYNYQYLLTNREAIYATDQERKVAEAFNSNSQQLNWIGEYVERVYCQDKSTDNFDTVLSGTSQKSTQYLTIETIDVKTSFYNVFDELLNKYYEKHKNDGKTLGAVKKYFKDSLVTIYGISNDTFNSIRREKYGTVSRRILFKLFFALELDYEDAKRLLESIGYDFRRNVKEEVVIEAILKCDSHRRFIIYEVNDTLEKYGCEPLFT